MNNSTVFVDATKDLEFQVKQAHVWGARVKDPCNCVLARALQDHFGSTVDRIVVGMTVTKVYAGNRITRYKTPEWARQCLINFDITGKWTQPIGLYSLYAIPEYRRYGVSHHAVKASKTKRPSKHARRAPTRNITLVAT